MDIAFHVVSGPQARVGAVQVTGDSGMSAEEFRRHAHLRSGAHVDHDTANRALTGVLKHYQGEERLEAEIKLESEQYAADSKKTGFRFTASQGPQVKVLVEGAKMGAERVKHVIPIFEEGTVDDDLLNEGNRRLRNYYQRLGYFDVKVDHECNPPAPRRWSSSIRCGWGRAAASSAFRSPETATSTRPRSRSFSVFMPPMPSTATGHTARRWSQQT